LEEISDQDLGLQGRILEALAPLLKGAADQVVGDAAFLIGRIRDPRKNEVLAGLLNHPNPEIVEIAREGLAES
jgi:HEAT repeat protein